jgi:hypothetical protein
MRKLVLWMFGLVVVISLVGFPGRAGAQNVVTPTVLPAPPGKLTIVNNGPGDAFDPHVSGNLISYSTGVGGIGYSSTVRYFDLSTGLDVEIPPGSGTYDAISDVSGSTVVFIRVSAPNSSVFSFDTATPGAQPVEVSPVVNASRTNPQIGGNTIAWEDYGISNIPTGNVIAYDIPTGATTPLSNDPNPVVNQSLTVSPDGSVVTWEKCADPGAPCDIWSATGGGTTWVTHQLTNGNGACGRPDTNGQIVVYSCDRGSGLQQLFWQPATGATEETLASVLADEEFFGIAGQFVSFTALAPGAPNHDLYVLDLSTLNLYQITNTPSADEELNDISIAPNGNVNVAWTVHDPNTGKFNVYAYTFNLPVGDFNFGAISPLTIAAGGSGSTNVAVNPVNGFSSAVSLSVTGQPAGVSERLTPNQVTPSGGNPASSVLNVSVADFVAPTNITLTVTGTSGSHTHSATANVTVIATESSIGNLIGDLVNAGCVDPGVGNALTSKLAAAQSAANTQTAINTLTALKNQINSQAGKHIATSCMLAGVTINAATVLLLDVQSLIDSLRVSMTPDPITGYVGTSGLGVPGAAVTILDANGNTVATATNDITGFYFIATTEGVLTPGATYTLQVTGFPAGFTNSTPANQTFTWQGGAITFSDFVLN